MFVGGVGGFLVDERSLVFSVNSGFCYYMEKNLSERFSEWGGVASHGLQHVSPTVFVLTATSGHWWNRRSGRRWERGLTNRSPATSPSTSPPSTSYS